MPLPEEVAKQVAGDLEEVGFEVELRSEEWSTYLPLVQDGRHQMCLLGWSADLPDADNFLYVLLDKTNARKGSANNVSFYESEEVHRLLEEARYSYDEARRLSLYRSAQEIIHRDCPMVPLVGTNQFIAHREGFGPLAPEPVTHPILARVTAPPDGRLRFARGSDSVTLDPANATDGESSNVIEQVFDGLVRFKAGSGEVEPALAESWTHSEDGKTWTFRLRLGVRFHDGSHCDAAAVVNAFERQRRADHPHHKGGVFAYWQDLLGGFVDRVEVGADAREVVFRCGQPAPAFFLAILAVFAFGIPSPAALEAHGADFGRRPVGTGAFRFVDWRTGSREIRLERNDGWWGGKPALQEVVFQVAPDATARSLRLEAGDADLIDNLAPETIERLEGAAGVVVVERPGLNLAYLAMNNQVAPFDDPRVREAVAWAIDKERIVKAAYAGRARVAEGPVPATVAGFHDGLPARRRDPARARALLDEYRASRP
jgi:ABC-type transport system substrate-binding protein